MRLIKTKRIPNTALLFILTAPFTILFYASYVFNFQHAGNIFLYVLQLIADAIAIIILGTLWLTILLDIIQPEYHKRDITYDNNWPGKANPQIDVLIPVANEPISIIETTVRKALLMSYQHKTFVLDDGASDEVQKIAEKYGAFYLRRPPHKKGFAKSGNLAYGLEFSKGEFFAVFDADHMPEKNFIVELLPFFENENVALVQTPQFYINTEYFIASGTAQAQEIFYKYVQPAKNSYNASFCVGTNMIYRRRAIDEIGGIALMDHSEDIWTTILLHEKGYESVFYNKVLARGRAPETIPSFFRQQNRWAQGGFSLFFSHNPLFVAKLSADQKLQYFFSNIHYFSAFSILIYLLIPILYMLFGWHSMDVLHNKGWFLHYIPYFVTVYFLPLFLIGSLKMSTVSISIASFYPYLAAFFSVLLRNRYKWISTESKRTRPILMREIWPHVLIIFLSLLSVVVGWYNTFDVATTLVTTFWVLLNAYFLFTFVRIGVVKS